MKLLSLSSQSRQASNFKSLFSTITMKITSVLFLALTAAVKVAAYPVNLVADCHGFVNFATISSQDGVLFSHALEDSYNKAYNSKTGIMHNVTFVPPSKTTTPPPPQAKGLFKAIYGTDAVAPVGATSGGYESGWSTYCFNPDGDDGCFGGSIPSNVAWPRLLATALAATKSPALANVACKLTNSPAR
jgi:hypothetical protein